MAAHSIDAEQAFDLLRTTSSRTNTKLAQGRGADHPGALRQLAAGLHGRSVP